MWFYHSHVCYKKIIDNSMFYMKAHDYVPTFRCIVNAL